MKKVRDSLVAVVPACCIALVFTFAPVDSSYTGGIIGAEPLCAQEDPADAWEAIGAVAEWICGGDPTYCEMGCDPTTGDVSWFYCFCIQ